MLRRRIDRSCKGKAIEKPFANEIEQSTGKEGYGRVQIVEPLVFHFGSKIIHIDFDITFKTSENSDVEGNGDVFL